MTDLEPGDGPSATPGDDGLSVSEGPETATPQPRRVTLRFAWGAMVVILIAVVILLVYAFNTPSNPSDVIRRSHTSSTVLSQVGHVPTSVFDAIGVTTPTTPLTPPTTVSGPSLVESGKPEVLYVGAEFCSFCGAERWALVVALSRFGHFVTLANMQSTPQSAFPSIQSFSFVGTSYASKYLSFTGIELYSNAVDPDGTFTRIANLTSQQSALVDRYGGGTGNVTSYPFVDIDNMMVAGNATFSPGVLSGLSQVTIAGDLDQTHDASTQAIVASANYLSAGMCHATKNQPAAVCTSRGVVTAARALAGQSAAGGS